MATTRNGRNRVLGEVANVVPVERVRRKPLGTITIPIKSTKTNNVPKDSAIDNLKAELKKKAVQCEKENEVLKDQSKVKSIKENVKVEDKTTEEVSKSKTCEIIKENVALENLTIQDENVCDAPTKMSIDDEIHKTDDEETCTISIDEDMTKIQIDKEVTKVESNEETANTQISEEPVKILEEQEVVKILVDDESSQIQVDEEKATSNVDEKPKEVSKSEPQSEDKENVEDVNLTIDQTDISEDVSEMSIDTFEPHEDDWCFSKMLMLSIPEYEEEIQKYLLRLQVKTRADPSYLVKHKNELNARMRTILIDWMVEVVEEYKMTSETLFLAVNFVDRFLSVLGVARAKFQLLGTTALFISSKYEEIYPPDVHEFVYITDNAYNKKDILGMEHKVLKTLDFNISAPTIHYFLRKHLSSLGLELGLPQSVGIMAEYLCYLALMECDPCIAYLPNDIAVSAIILAAHTFGITLEVTGETGQAFFPGYSKEQIKAHLIELQSCIDTLHRLRRSTKEENDALFEAGKPQQAIYNKYAQEKYFSVSLIDIGDQKSPKLLP